MESNEEINFSNLILKFLEIYLSNSYQKSYNIHTYVRILIFIMNC